MTFIDPPWRLDPFQNIVNANFGGLGPWLIIYLWEISQGLFPLTISTFNAGRRLLPESITLMGPENIGFQTFPNTLPGQKIGDIVTPYMQSSLAAWVAPSRDFGIGLTRGPPVVGIWFDAYAVFNLGLIKAISPAGSTRLTFQFDQPPTVPGTSNSGAVMATVKVGYNNPTFIGVFDRPVVGYGFPIKSLQRREGPGMLITEGPSPGFPSNQPTAFYLNDFFWGRFFPSLPPPGTVVGDFGPPYWGSDPLQAFFGYINSFFSTDPWSGGSSGNPGNCVTLQTNFYAVTPFFNDMAAPVFAVREETFIAPGRVAVDMTTGQFLIGPRS